MAGVIIRGATTIVGGHIHHDDTPMTWHDADAAAGFRLDRRKSWAFIDGKLCETVSWSQNCSGCDGMGCRECGYHGVSRRSTWVPAPPPKPQEMP